MTSTPYKEKSQPLTSYLSPLTVQGGSADLRVSHLRRAWVWMTRITHCRGFGIQSPNDYWLVRYVINEHWPYYQYDILGLHDHWLTRKLGLLYFRLANWLQPGLVIDPLNSPYWQAGCHKAKVVSQSDKIELARIVLDQALPNPQNFHPLIEHALQKADCQSVVVVEGIWRNWQLWNTIITDPRVYVTFDLYYCGILMFDKKRAKKNYIINF